MGRKKGVRNPHPLGTLFEVICQSCGVHFLVPPNRSNAKYCSWSCWKKVMLNNLKKFQFKEGHHVSPKTEFKKGEHPSPETEFTTERLKELWKNSEFRAKMAHHHHVGTFKEKWLNPSFRSKILELLKNKPPQMRAKISSTLKRKYKDGTIKPFWKGKKNVGLMQRYGKRDEFERKKFLGMHIRPTEPEKQFLEICQNHDLPFRYVGDGQFVIAGLNPDFIHNNGEKIAVEIFGTYWHSPLLRPKICPSQTLITRKKIFQQQGWDLIVFWEDEVMCKNGEQIVVKRLSI